MVTFKPIIIPGNRRKDGTWPVCIRVTFKGKSRRLATTLVCRSADITRTHRIKDANILNKAEALIARMRDAVKEISPFDLENRDVDYVVGRVKDSLSGEDFHLDFFAFAEAYIATKAPTTRLSYISALNSFKRHLKRSELDINSISRQMLLEFMEAVDNEPRMHYDPKTGKTVPSKVAKKIPLAASSRHITKLGHIYEAARDRYNDEDADRILIPKNPFARISKVHPPSIGQRNLGVELMQKIISAQVDSEPMRTALDVFILSSTAKYNRHSIIVILICYIEIFPFIRIILNDSIIMFSIICPYIFKKEISFFTHFWFLRRSVHHSYFQLPQDIHLH